MALTQIQLSGNSYNSFATVAEADRLLIPTEFAMQWAALTDDDKAGRLIQSTRLIRSFAEFSELSGDELNVNLACARLAIAPVAEEAGEQRLTAGSVSLTIRKQDEIDRYDRVAIRMLRTAVATSVGTDYGSSDLPQTPEPSFDSYAGAN